MTEKATTKHLDPAQAASNPATVIADLLKVVDMLMPGVGAIAVQDYALLNDAPLRARRWLAANQSGV